MSINSIDSQLGDIIDPKLRKIGERVVRQLELAADKAAAHAADAKRFPLPTQQDSAENILAGWFDTMSAKKRAAAGAAAVQRLKPSATRTAHLGELVGVDLQTRTPIASQGSAFAIPNLKFSAADLAKLQNPVFLRTLGGMIPQHAPARATRSDSLMLRVTQVRCANETNSPFGGHIGEDDMWLGGTSVDESGDTKTIEPIKLGSFDNKEVKHYQPPRNFTTFNITERGNSFPKAYLVTLVLVERDNGKAMRTFLDRVTREIKKQVQDALIKVGKAIGGSFGLVVGTISAWVFGELIDYISSGWRDTVFRPLTVTAHVGSYDSVWVGSGRKDSTDRMLETKAPQARYQLWYDWLLYNSAAGLGII
ncbi:hypothetical protein ACFWPX_08920 [Nocardia sp. NPDC058518]|uniref:hypothetical protein n=1 Tax=Nocardia sp. NPDC058518 TaxID=3346534 RepID=UPI00365A8735